MEVRVAYTWIRLDTEGHRPVLVQVAERLRTAVQALAEVEGRSQLGLSITLGLAELQPGESIEQALMRADRALYDGKQAGRNRVIPAGQA